MSISCPFKPMGGGYEFFDYIENQPSRVGEHIDLEVNINALTFTAEYEVYHIEGYTTFVGSYLSETQCWLVANKDTFVIFPPGRGAYNYTRINTPCNLKIQHNLDHVICNGVRYNSSIGLDIQNIPMRINGTTNVHGTKQYKYVKIYDGPTLIRDLIPAKRICDGWTGMYCRVGNKFYGGTKVDSFLVGNYT